MAQQLTAFVLTCLVVVLVPGPDFALVLRNAARGPRAAATAVAGSWWATLFLRPWPCLV